MPERIIIATIKGSHRAFRKTSEFFGARPLMPVITKAILFGFFLFYAQESGFSFWPVMLFLLVALGSYLQPVVKTLTFGTGFFLTVALSLLLTSRFTITLPTQMHAGIVGKLLFVASFAFLFFVLLGIKNIVLVRRREWYTVLFIGLVYGVNLLFFTSITSANPSSTIALSGLLTMLLLREYFIVQELRASRALLLMNLTITLGLIQISWALSLLPLGFSKAASLSTLFCMAGATIVERYVRGTLSGKFLRVNFLTVVILVLVIFFSARWTI